MMGVQGCGVAGGGVVSAFRQPKPRCAELRIGDRIQLPPAWPQTIKERKKDNTGWWLTDDCGIGDYVFDNYVFNHNSVWQALEPDGITP